MTDPDFERSALKEWSVLCDAMADGEIIALVRKGGIREQRSGFSVRHDRFLLYPTYFHERIDELAARFQGVLRKSMDARPAADTVLLSHVATVAAVWRVTEASRLPAIEGEHGLTAGAVESRFGYRNRPEVHVVAIRLAALHAPTSQPALPRYSGCVSWVELGIAVDVATARPVLSDAAFSHRLQRLRDALGAPEPAA
ncbi:MAG: DUF1802 family protein [Gemmatimonadaceae bacterium]